LIRIKIRRAQRMGEVLPRRPCPGSPPGCRAIGEDVQRDAKSGAKESAVDILTPDETTLWCSQNEITLTGRGLPEKSDAFFRFTIPEDAGRRVWLVSQGMRAFRDEPAFLVWFDDWSVWPSGQRMHVFDRFRLSYGESRPLIESPGHTFAGRDIEDAISFVTLAVLFLWDCYVVTPQRSKLLFFSHNEYGCAKGIDLDFPADQPPARHH
jgi:hypothetical protein